LEATLNAGYNIKLLDESQTIPACAATYDAVVDRLNAVQHVQFKQGRAFLEGITGGIMPNLYTVSDMTYKYQPMRNGQPYGEPEGWPMFIVEEVSGDCCSRDCWCRCCCNPQHPSITELYLSSGPRPQEDCCCGLCTQPDTADKIGDPIMTYERLGCCSRFANCFVCCEQCQDEMRFHQGGGLDVDRAGDNSTQAVTSVGKVPIGGGGCTPTVEVFKMAAPGTVTTNDLTPAFLVEGPTCFGGLYDWCCDTSFFVSSAKGAKGDMATITKMKPHDCATCCRAMCTTADIYELQFPNQQVAPDNKAIILGEMVHLDYMFFENDRFPITCEKQGDTTYITILFCLCYCYGCLCPIKCVIPLPENK
jgi:hypothetical protein